MKSWSTPTLEDIKNILEEVIHWPTTLPSIDEKPVGNQLS